MFWSVFSANKKKLLQPAHNFRTLGTLINGSKGISGSSLRLFPPLIHLNL